MNAVQSRCEAEVAKIVKAAGVRFKALSEVPVDVIRHAQRGPVPGMRVTHLAPDLRAEFLEKPITEDLLCLRAGYHVAPPAHYMPRPDGSYDTILIYCADGRGWLEMAGRTWTVEKHCAFLIPAHAPHKYGADPDDPWTTYWVHFQGRQADAYAELITPPAGSPVFHLSRYQDSINGIEQLYLYMSQVHTYANLVAASGALSQLLTLIQLRMHSSELRTRTADQGLEKTVEFMHRNLSRRLTLKELSAIAGMSSNHYGTLFGRRYGSTPIDYFNRLRIQNACELLTTSDLRVSEVSEQLGFSDPYYFSRMFKKIMGVSPRDYR